MGGTRGRAERMTRRRMMIPWFVLFNFFLLAYKLLLSLPTHSNFSSACPLGTKKNTQTTAPLPRFHYPPTSFSQLALTTFAHSELALCIFSIVLSLSCLPLPSARSLLALYILVISSRCISDAKRKRGLCCFRSLGPQPMWIRGRKKCFNTLIHMMREGYRGRTEKEKKNSSLSSGISSSSESCRAE
ncbi:uncharacterized protein IWZ02DRAFT_73192 [Phyllosticta citriasiana]|uniref:Transmembrane protein n=1 Tax=Phyllosticta citriasiana TaxID=595635 RepID=A0ABR1KT11_9PEZI